MKTLFFLVIIANVALFMWEYKTGAFVPVTEISEQNADSDQEQILLVSELTNVPQVIAPATVSEQLAAEKAATAEAGKPAPVPGSLSEILENIDKPALEKSIAGDSNVSELTKVLQVMAPATVSGQPVAESAATAEAGKPAQQSGSLPAISENIEKPDSEKAAATDSTISNDEKIAASCYEVGPFADQKAYKSLVNRLKDIKSEIKPINRDVQIASNYMVYYPAAQTEFESGDAIKMLKSHGIKDLWPLSGEDKGKISLGLFIKEENALVMKNELLAKGINAEVTARYKTKPQKYALVKGDNSVMERLDILKNTYPQLAVKQIEDEAQGCW